MSSIMPGSRLGPYEVLALIGAGGMGEVWKARDTRLDRIVAIKVSKEKFSERFEREARAVAALNRSSEVLCRWIRRLLLWPRAVRDADRQTGLPAYRSTIPPTGAIKCASHFRLSFG